MQTANPAAAGSIPLAQASITAIKT